MKSFQSLIVILAAILMVNTSVVAGSKLSLRAAVQEGRALVEEDQNQRKLVFHIPNFFHPHPPPKKPSDSNGSGSGSNGSGGRSATLSPTSLSGSASAATSSDISSTEAKKSMMLMLGVAAAVGMVIAAIAIPRRNVATDDHALKGSLNKRIRLFTNLAKHAPSRPPRRDETGRYINADDMA